MKSQNILTGILILLVLGVLIQQRFFVPVLPLGISESTGLVQVDRNGTIRTAETKLHRGEILKTGEDGRTRVQIGFGTEIFLDHNTDLRVDVLGPDNPTITLLRGRIYIDTHADREQTLNEGPLTIKTLRTSVLLPSGKLSLVNYDFLETLAIYPIHTPVTVTQPNGDTVTMKDSGELHETTPVSWKGTTFDPTSGSASEFYSWAMTL